MENRKMVDLNQIIALLTLNINDLKLQLKGKGRMKLLDWIKKQDIYMSTRCDFKCKDT